MALYLLVYDRISSFMLTLWIVTGAGYIGNENGAMEKCFFVFVHLYVCFRLIIYLENIALGSNPFMVALNGYVILLYYLFIHSLIH